MPSKNAVVAAAAMLVASIAAPAHAATVSWQLATVGNWHDPVVWYSTSDLTNPFRRPTINDTVFIDSRTGLGTTVTINAATGTAQAQFLVLDALLKQSGGSLNTVVSYAGNGGGDAAGRFLQTGGTHQTARLAVGQAEGFAGAYEMRGSASLNAGIVLVGNAGIGSFYQFGGNSVVNASLTNPIGLVLGNDEESCRKKPTAQCYGDILNISPSWYSRGLYELHGGNLTVYGDVAVGLYGEGIFRQSGGSHTIRRGALGSGNLHIGGMAGASDASGRVGSSYALSGNGSLDVAGQTLVGVVASGSFSQTGGAHRTAGLVVGAGTTGEYTLNGGSLETGKTQIATGAGLNVGTFTQNGGSHRSSSLIVSDSRNGFGSYAMTGGTLDVASDYIPDGVNFSPSGTTVGVNGFGVFSHSGGTHVTGQLILGAAGGSVYALSGNATLVAGSVAQGVNPQPVAADSFKFNGGRLSVITFHGDLFNIGGTLAPSSNAVLTAAATTGTTRITGDYRQAAAGSMLIELGGTAGGLYDKVAVGGTATLDGALSVVFVNGFSASAGDSFEILSATSLVGQFNAVGLAALGPGLLWNTHYSLDPAGTDTLRLFVTSAVPEPETWALFLAGLAAVGAMARRSKTASAARADQALTHPAG